MAHPTIAFPVGPAVTRADLPGLCADLAGMLRGRPPGVVTCHVTGGCRRDVVTVEALARLTVTARRHGWRLVVAGVDPDLRLLVGLLGLSEALPESGRQPERREQAIGVEEAGDRPDPPG
ncbi:STAS domain-containing protein [Micromonospora sp. NPDC049366]|uniref:STAS domain-containing protein n=1 Tax=Micromonospora sp. NPDC049366 TaxID=3364271 RepID=UPI0037AF8DE2